MSDLMARKMDIAKRAGILSSEITSLSQAMERIDRFKRRSYSMSITVNLGENDSKRRFDSGDLEGRGTELHTVLITYLQSQIAKRENELNELIKIPQ